MTRSMVVSLLLLLGACGDGGKREAPRGSTPGDGSSRPNASHLVEPPRPSDVPASVLAPEAPPSASAPLPDGLVAAPDRTAPLNVLEDGKQACPAGMVLVDGDYCPGLAQNCLEWAKVRDPSAKGVAQRCLRFETTSRCLGGTQHRRFCIDKYEYPNLPGVKPVVMPDWYDALRACDIEGKRLCLSSEWTFACEGREWLPYPYGYVRDKRVCNFDRPRPQPEPRFNDFAIPRRIGAEVARLDLRVPSGALQGCVSPFGVYDMTGNVDEWVINEDHFKEVPGKKPPFISGLKGGYWGPIRARCRPMTTSHEELFRFYQVGFRCCADALDRPDGVAQEYVQRLGKWRRQAGLP